MAKAARREEPVEDDPDVEVEDEIVDEDEVDELTDELDGALDDDEDVVVDEGEADEEELPEGFTVVGPGDGEEEDADESLGRTVVPAVEDDERAVAVLEAAARGGAPADEDDDEDGLAIQRDGEFVCRRCHLVKRDTQLARPRLLICRDCA